MEASRAALVLDVEHVDHASKGHAAGWQAPAPPPRAALSTQPGGAGGEAGRGEGEAGGAGGEEGGGGAGGEAGRREGGGCGGEGRRAPATKYQH